MSDSGFFTILFHALYDKEHAAQKKHPNLFISVEEFRTCIDLIVNSNISFIDYEKGFREDPQKKQVLLTFDDGYYNNFYGLDVLAEFDIKAIFFLVKHQIINQKLFWWDVYFKNRIKQVPFSTLYGEIQLLKKLQRREIESKLIEMFGMGCFDETDELCRPMTVKELRDFSKSPHVSIGVHTDSHEILTNCDSQQIKKEISDCKVFLENTINKKISVISYPNGNVNDDIISISKQLGFKVGLTTQEGINNYHDLVVRKDWLGLNRNTFPIPGDKRSVVDQVRAFISENFRR